MLVCCKKYTYHNGGLDWPHQWETCEGQQQSPINVIHNKVFLNDQFLSFNYDYDFKSYNMKKYLHYKMNPMTQFNSVNISINN